MPLWDIEWTPTGSVIVDEYHIYLRLKNDPDWTRKGSTRATSFRLTIADSSRIHEVGVAPVVNGLEAQEEDWTVDEFRPSSRTDLDSIGALSNFTVAQNGADVIAQWDEVDEPSATHIEIRDGASWATAQIVSRVRLPATTTRIGWPANGSRTYRAKLKTAAGVYSDEATSTVVVQGQAYFPVKAANDEHGGGFGGTKTDVEVNAGNLEPVALPASYANWTNPYSTYTHPWWWPYVPDGTYVTDADDAGSVVDEKLEIDLTTGLIDSAPTYDKWYGQVAGEIDDTVNPAGVRTIGEPSVYDRIDQDGNLVDGPQVKIEIDTTPDDPAASPTWDGWRVWIPGAIYRFRGVRVRITLVMWWPFIYPRITGFTWKRRRLNRKDEQTVTVIATGGTSVTWDQSFTAAPIVGAPAVIGSNGWYAQVDAVTTSGCTVRVFNASGTEQSSGTVHVVAMGV